MTTERFNFITRDEFDAHSYKTDQRFDQLTTTMLGEFDKVHTRFAQTDTRLDSIEIRLTTLTEDSKELKIGMKYMGKRMNSLEEKMERVLNTLEVQGKRIDESNERLKEQGKRIDRHTEILVEQGKRLDKHTEILKEQSRKLDVIIGS